jgi:hypothetical protein
MTLARLILFPKTLMTFLNDVDIVSSAFLILQKQVVSLLTLSKLKKRKMSFVTVATKELKETDAVRWEK